MLSLQKSHAVTGNTLLVGVITSPCGFNEKDT